MDAYLDSNLTTDSSLSGGCCCETSTTTETWTEPWTETFTEPAPLVDDVSVFDTEPQAWNPEPVSYSEPVATYEDLAGFSYEAAPASVPEVPVASDLTTTMTIGGDPFGDFTITNPDGSPADLGPSTMTIGGVPAIGPSGVDTTANSLATIYGVAAENGDIMSQIMVRDIMASQNAAIRAWTLPSGLYVY